MCQFGAYTCFLLVKGYNCSRTLIIITQVSATHVKKKQTIAQSTMFFNCLCFYGNHVHFKQLS